MKKYVCQFIVDDRLLTNASLDTRGSCERSVHGAENGAQRAEKSDEQSGAVNGSRKKRAVVADFEHIGERRSPKWALTRSGKCRTPLHGHRLRTCCTTPSTDELTTILQLVVQQIHHQRTKICHIPTSLHVEILGSGIAMWQICCTTSCRTVVRACPLVVLYNMSVTADRCPCCSAVWHLTRSSKTARSAPLICSARHVAVRQDDV